MIEYNIRPHMTATNAYIASNDRSARLGAAMMVKTVLLGCSIMMSGNLFAQSNENSTTATEDTRPLEGKTAASDFEDIVVTARRRSEAAQDVPVTISAVSGEELKSRQITDFSEVQFLVPTLRVSAGTSGRQSANFSLRGLRSNGVVLYFNEVPVSSDAANRALYDLQNIQVLKGPQGTLFGTNTTAGAILIQPARPTHQTEGFVELQAGNRDMIGGQAMFNVPLTDSLSLRAAGQFKKRAGLTKYVSNIPGPTLRNQDSEDYSSFRISLLFDPVEGFENLLTIDRFYADEEPSYKKITAISPCPGTPSIGQLLTLGACKYRPPLTTTLGLPSFEQFFATESKLGPFETANPYQGRSLTDSWGATNITSFALNDQITIKNIFGYWHLKANRTSDGDGTIFDSLQSNYISKTRHVSNEVQVQADISRLKLIVGAYYSNDRVDGGNFFRSAAPGPLDPIVRDNTNIDENKAIFAQATYAVTDRLNVTAGARYTWQTKDVRSVDFTGGRCSFPATNPAVDIVTCTFRASVEFREPSWTFGLDYNVAPNVLVYGTARRGFNGGGVNTTPPVPYDTEKLDDIEIGAKSEFRLGGVPIRANISAFRSKYSGIQRRITAFVDNVPAAYIRNASAAKVQGIEIQGDIHLGQLDLSASGTYLDAKYTNFQTELAPGQFADLTANALAQAPKYTGSVTAAYHVPIDAKVAERLTASVTWSYQSVIYFEDFNQLDATLNNRIDPFNTQSAFSIWNAQLSASNVLGTGFGVQAFIKNIANKLYAVSKSNALGSFGFATSIWGEPRTYGVAINYRF